MTPTLNTPAQSWERMREGNRRFVANEPSHPHQDVERRSALANQQTPFAALFGCADSRLAAEIIFDVGLGDLFVIRNAGQVIDETILGSLEYAVAALEVPLIVVLAHDQCGAVQATMDASSGKELPDGFYLRDLVTRIQPAVVRARREGDGSVEEVARIHLSNTATQLIERSEVLAAKVAEGKLAVVGVDYQLAHGDVTVDVVIGDIGEDAQSVAGAPAQTPQ